MSHLDIHKNKAGCCCLPPMMNCVLCPTHSLDLRYQDLSLSHWPIAWEPEMAPAEGAER